MVYLRLNNSELPFVEGAYFNCAPSLQLQVKAACNKPGLVPKLEIIVVELEKCKKSLSEYLR